MLVLNECLLDNDNLNYIHNNNIILYTTETTLFSSKMSIGKDITIHYSI